MRDAGFCIWNDRKLAIGRRYVSFSIIFNGQTESPELSGSFSLYLISIRRFNLHHQPGARRKRIRTHLAVQGTWGLYEASAPVVHYLGPDAAYAELTTCKGLYAKGSLPSGTPSSSNGLAGIRRTTSVLLPIGSQLYSLLVYTSACQESFT